jgi:NADPH-dependent 2,4-dienoyl-CoA reductase/sulfur reductase-like enzyme
VSGVFGVVGASLAGLGAARALRRQGFDGRLIVMGTEVHRPYDRPPLSKDFLAGKVDASDLALESDDEDLDIDWCLGVAASGLDAAGRAVQLADGRSLAVDGLVIATGAVPCTLPGADRYDNVHVLRTLEDAVALRGKMLAGRRLVVVGGGLIGLEVASTARTLGLDVTVVDSQPLPLVPVLGPVVGRALAVLHGDHGVRLVAGTRVTKLVGAGSAEGVELHDGRRLAADLVVIGIGVRPAVEWLQGSGVQVDRRGVLCDAAGSSSVPNVVAVGDCSAWYDPHAGDHRREEHWTAARERAAVAAASLLGGSAAPAARPPYFWSDQFGLRLQFAGRCRPDDVLTVEDGDPRRGGFLAVYRREGRPVGVVALDHSRSFMRRRRELAVLAAEEHVGPSFSAGAAALVP